MDKTKFLQLAKTRVTKVEYQNQVFYFRSLSRADVNESIETELDASLHLFKRSLCDANGNRILADEDDISELDLGFITGLLMECNTINQLGPNAIDDAKKN